MLLGRLENQARLLCGLCPHWLSKVFTNNQMSSPRGFSVISLQPLAPFPCHTEHCPPRSPIARSFPFVNPWKAGRLVFLNPFLPSGLPELLRLCKSCFLHSLVFVIRADFWGCFFNHLFLSPSSDQNALCKEVVYLVTRTGLCTQTHQVQILAAPLNSVNCLTNLSLSFLIYKMESLSDCFRGRLRNDGIIQVRA